MTGQPQDRDERTCGCHVFAGVIGPQLLVLCNRHHADFARHCDAGLTVFAALVATARDELTRRGGADG